MLYGVTGTDSSLQFCSSMQWRQVIVKNMQKCPQNFLPPPFFFAESVLMWTSRMREFAVACCLALHRAQLSFSDTCCAPNLLCSCLLVVPPLLILQCNLPLLHVAPLISRRHNGTVMFAALRWPPSQQSCCQMSGGISVCLPSKTCEPHHLFKPLACQS